MKISVLIPFRSNDPQRIRLWNWLRPQWEALDVELCSTVDSDDPTATFSFARGANRCRAMATGNVLLVHGADQLPPDESTWARIRSTMAWAPFMWVYAQNMDLGPWVTRLILQGCHPDLLPPGPVFNYGEAIYAVRADVWDEVGGLDERFVGWGPEDAAFRLLLSHLYPDGVTQGEGIMRALWHEWAPRDLTKKNYDIYEQEYLPAAAAGRMREYWAEVRAGWLTSRP